MPAKLTLPEGILGIEFPFTLRNGWQIVSAWNGDIVITNDEDDAVITIGAAPEWIVTVTRDGCTNCYDDGKIINRFDADDYRKNKE